MVIEKMPVDAVVGLQRGDEGKGRFVDMLSGEYDIVARFNGGNRGRFYSTIKHNIIYFHEDPIYR